MTLRKLMIAVVFVALLVMGFAVAPAYADDVDYTLTDGVNTITFTVPQDPTPIATNPDWFAVSTAVTIDGTTSTEDVTFFDTTFKGGLAIASAPDVDGILDQQGPQLFTSGTTTLLTFTDLPLTCTFISPATGCSADTFQGPFTLNALDVPTTPTSAPEPGSFGLTLAGVGLLGLMIGIRKRTAQGLAIAS